MQLVIRPAPLLQSIPSHVPRLQPRYTPDQKACLLDGSSPRETPDP